MFHHMIVMLKKVLLNQERIMSGMDDLKTEIASLSDAISAAVAALTTARAGDSDADVEAAAQQLHTLTASLKTAVAAIPGSAP